MIPRSIFESEHETFRNTVGAFLDKEVVPFHEQWEKDGQVDRNIWNKAGEAGLLCFAMPEQYGGVEAEFRYNAIMVEEVAKRGVSGLGFGVHSDICAPYILHNGSEALKEKYLPKMVTGEKIAAIAMTEPGTGSDLQAVKTTAILDGDEYVVNGSKTFITNGQHCDLVIVVCKTDPSEGAKGISLIILDADSEGFTKGRNLEKIGLKAQDTSELFFDNVRVPKENLLGQEGMGFVYLMQELSQERLTIGVGALAAAQGVFEHTKTYVNERQAFGKPVAAFQNTRFKLAEMSTSLTVGQVFVDRCIELHVEGKLDAITASKIKYWTTDMQCKLTDECLQLHGGYGYMWEYPVARAWADSRIQRIYGGTNEIMKEIIARSL